jgi:hypothetical protein
MIKIEFTSSSKSIELYDNLNKVIARLVSSYMVDHPDESEETLTRSSFNPNK